MIRRALVTTLMLVAVPLSLSAQRPAQADARIEAARARVAQAGIPVGLLEQKVAEGRAKNVPLERIAVAVERRAHALVAARQAMAGAGRELSSGELSAGANAIEAGVDGGVLRSLIETARAEDAPVALAVLAHLVGEGMVPARALEAVQNAMARGGDALANLPVQAAAARARQGRPETAGRPGGMGAPGGADARPGSNPTPPAGVPAGGPRRGPGGNGGPPGGQ